MVNSEPFSLQPPPEETRAEAVERKARASGDALRDRGLEYATRRNGVPMHNRDTQRVCEAAGVRFHRTKHDRLWIEAWAVAALTPLKGKLDTLKVRVLRHYAEAPEEERAALLTVWRTGNREALKAMVDPGSWTKAGMQRAARDEAFRRNAERKVRSKKPAAASAQQELP